jgi:hypothetical protein
MKFLGFAYRIISNFIFLALVYYSLNFMEKYQQRAILAILVLAYAGMRAVSAFRSFYFYQRVERLELEARRLAGIAGEGPAADASRKQIVNSVGALRRDGEMKSYIDHVSRAGRLAVHIEDRHGLILSYAFSLLQTAAAWLGNAIRLFSS